MLAVSWVCLHCQQGHKVQTDLLECTDPKCPADVHSTWMECKACGWETRVVRRVDDGSIVVTHKRVSSTGKAGTA